MGGISAASQGRYENCYNVGKLSFKQDSIADTFQYGAIITDTAGGAQLINCYALLGTAPLAIGTDSTSTGAPYFKTAEEMQSPSFAATLNGDTLPEAWKPARTDGAIRFLYPWPSWMMDDPGEPGTVSAPDLGITDFSQVTAR